MTKASSSASPPKSLSERRNEAFSGTLACAGLFAGIGGLELGLSKAGHHTVLLCENDDAATTVLAKRFPGIPLAADVRTMRSLPTETELVCAGFPCQNLTQVGDKKGIAGGQSSLVEHVFRLLRKRPVQWVIIENVSFMLQLDRGSAIKKIIESLESLGYHWAYRIVDSFCFGVPQRRRRVFIVASLEYDPRAVLLADDAGPLTSVTALLTVPLGFYWTEGNAGVGLAVDSVPPLKGGSGLGIPSAPAILFPEGLVATPHIRDAERLQGFPAGWTDPASTVERASIRWRLIGNAVTVPVAKWLGKRLLKPGNYSGEDDPELSARDRWPNAAWNLGDGRRVSKVSENPFANRASLMNFLRHEGRPLSVKATDGFVRRVRNSGLRVPRGFLAALERHASRAEHRGSL